MANLMRSLMILMLLAALASFFLTLSPAAHAEGGVLIRWTSVSGEPPWTRVDGTTAALRGFLFECDDRLYEINDPAARHYTVPVTLAPGAVLRCRGVAVDADGQRSAWSEWKGFTQTLAPPVMGSGWVVAPNPGRADRPLYDASKWPIRVEIGRIVPGVDCDEFRLRSTGGREWRTVDGGITLCEEAR